VKKFGELFFEAMDDTIKDVFGEYASALIRGFMEREGVGEKIEVFNAFLERLLGLEGAKILESIGLERLCLKLRREYDEVEKYFSFLDELYEVKFNLLVPSWKEEHLVCN